MRPEGKSDRLSVNVWLDVAMLKRIDERARLLGLSRSAYIASLCAADVDDLGGDGHGARRSTR